MEREFTLWVAWCLKIAHGSEDPTLILNEYNNKHLMFVFPFFFLLIADDLSFFLLLTLSQASKGLQKLSPNCSIDLDSS